MPLRKLFLKDFTAFDELELEFSPGLNIFIGLNGTGKTHVMKVLYSACRTVDRKVSFPQKLVSCFGTEALKISRLVRRSRGNNAARVSVEAGGREQQRTSEKLSCTFNRKTRHLDAEVTGRDGWERQSSKKNGIKNSIFIPAKEILANAYNLGAAVERGNVSFDDTYLDIINAAKIDLGTPVVMDGSQSNSLDESHIKSLEKIIGGKTLFDNGRDEFYLKKGYSKLEFNLVAEGVRKVALLWLLVKNGALPPGAILFWDEPDANINPTHIPALVDFLIALQHSGVQIFIATHDYILAKYFELRAMEPIAFFSFYDEKGTINCEKKDSFKGLKHNTIMHAWEMLLDEVYRDRME